MVQQSTTFKLYTLWHENFFSVSSHFDSHHRVSNTGESPTGNTRRKLQESNYMDWQEHFFMEDIRIRKVVFWI